MHTRILFLACHNTWWALLWVLELLHAFYPTPCALVSGNTQGQNRYMLPKVPWRNKNKQRKQNQYSQLAYTYLKRDKRVMYRRNLKQFGNHESYKNVFRLSGQSVWKPHREHLWTQEQYTSSTTYCCIHASKEQAPELWPYAAQTCWYSCRYLFQLYHVKSLLSLCRSVSTMSSVSNKDWMCQTLKSDLSYFYLHSLALHYSHKKQR